MKKIICKHIFHRGENYLYLLEGSDKKIQIPIVKGFNPIYQRYEICDEGFFKNS